MRFRRRKQESGRVDDGEGLRRLNRGMFRLFGPPSVGRYEGPYEEADPDPVCPFCGHRESEHTRVRTADGKMLRSCPAGNR
jgi:hypothetical protein